MLDVDYAQKLEKYFLKIGRKLSNKSQLREYISNLCDYLEIPRIKIVFISHKEVDRRDGIDTMAYFSYDCNRVPYVVFYTKGLLKEYVKHEIVHYIQFLQDAEDDFEDEDLDDGYEFEADTLAEFPEKKLKLFMKVRNFLVTCKRANYV